MTSAISRTICAITLCVGAAFPTFAQETPETNIDAKRDWSVFRASGEPKECWIVTIPSSSEATRNGEKVTPDRGDILLMVTNRPGTNTQGEISFKSGYPIKENSTVNLRVGSASFELFIDGEWAWPANPEEDQKVIAAMQRGASAVATAVSERGTTTVDNFSLLGFSAAMESAQTMCKE
jgi:hypothetical protein